MTYWIAFKDERIDFDVPLAVTAATRLILLSLPTAACWLCSKSSSSYSASCDSLASRGEAAVRETSGEVSCGETMEVVVPPSRPGAASSETCGGDSAGTEESGESVSPAEVEPTEPAGDALADEEIGLEVSGSRVCLSEGVYSGKYSSPSFLGVVKFSTICCGVAGDDAFDDTVAVMVTEPFELLCIRGRWFSFASVMSHMLNICHDLR